MEQGKINVTTENIFPIIKKFLYSDHEIFLRELVSNAVDATQKLKTLVSLGKANTELGDITIEIIANKELKTLTVRDKGIGMTGEEVQKYINQIAFSSAEEFLEKYKGGDSANIIGHFGLGFYSAFMVASKVEIYTRSYLSDAVAVKWSCTGSPDYSMETCDKDTRGTEIVLYMADDTLEFLEDNRLVSLLKKYCRFLPVPIQCGMEKHYEKGEGEEKEKAVDRPRIINNTHPLWKESPATLTEEQYRDFYRELYPTTFEQPLFHIHLNVDYPFNLSGILYFPKVKNRLEIEKNRVQLYSNQVFITDQLEGVIPEFMMLLHGVLDSPDIPLNVSRSYLQSDTNVKKISAHITKKVADKLEDMFKNDRADFEKKWDDLKVFVQYGMITDEKFNDRAKIFYLFKNIENKYFTFEEYRSKIEPLQKDKDGNLIYLYTTHTADQSLYIKSATEKGYDTLLMDGFLDTHFINRLESTWEKCRFTRVDADVIDKLISKDEILPAKLSETETSKLKGFFDKVIDASRCTVMVEPLSETDLPVLITRDEFSRRFQDMNAWAGNNDFSHFDHYNLIVNGNHPLYGKLLTATDEQQQETLTRQLVDLALLSRNMLQGDQLNEFVQRSVDLLK
ncbi:MAG: molecular chaperone HtpG [Bacteroidales bacterium]|jgi:molecular chaperone HtpG|nr:molecular chaperone HtpG [Bacteroidales bacterium]